MIGTSVISPNTMILLDSLSPSLPQLAVPTVKLGPCTQSLIIPKVLGCNMQFIVKPWISVGVVPVA